MGSFLIMYGGWIRDSCARTENQAQSSRVPDSSLQVPFKARISPHSCRMPKVHKVKCSHKVNVILRYHIRLLDATALAQNYIALLVACLLELHHRAGWAKSKNSSLTSPQLEYLQLPSGQGACSLASSP